LLIGALIKFLVLWRLSNQNWKPPVLRRNRTKPKPQFSGGYVMVFLKFQKWPSLITKVRNDNVITGHAMTPAATVWSNCLTVWSGVALQINYWPQWTRVTLRAPTELTDWPLAPESYVITHHVISHYYVASDCWSTDSSEKCKQLYVTWAYSEAYTYMWFSSCRTQHTQRNRCTACDAIRKPKYALNRFYPWVCCIFRVHAVHTLQFHDLLRMISVCCVRCVAYGSLETDLYVHLHRSTRGLQVAIRNTHKCKGDTAFNTINKPKLHNACTRKTQCMQSILFFACITFFDVSFVCMHCICCTAYDSAEPT